MNLLYFEFVYFFYFFQNYNANVFSLGLHHQGIFRVSGSQLEINNFRESFERMEDPLADVTDASDINSVAGVLKLYFRELREPLFPTVFFDQFMEIAREFAVVVIIYVCAHSLIISPFTAYSKSP